MSAFLGLSTLLVVAAIALLVLPMWRDRGNVPVAVTTALLAVLLPVAVVLLYPVVSNHDWNATPPPPAAAGAMPEIGEMVSRLEARLEANPDDLEGWMMLGRSYSVLERYPEAQVAWQRALDVSGGQSNEAALGLVEAMFLTNPDSLAGPGGLLVEDVLARAPNEPKALWYGGLAATGRGDTELAISRWEQLMQGPLPDEMRVVLQRQIDALRAASGMPAGEPVATAAATGSDWSVEVQLSELGEIPAGASLFLIARVPDAGGPPIAVKREAVGQLPRTLSLGEGDAMMAGRKLSDAPALEFVARISMRGTAIEEPGDFYGIARPEGTTPGAISIVIDQVVQ